MNRKCIFRFNYHDQIFRKNEETSADVLTGKSIAGKANIMASQAKREILESYDFNFRAQSNLADRARRKLAKFNISPCNAMISFLMLVFFRDFCFQNSTCLRFFTFFLENQQISELPDKPRVKIPIQFLKTPLFEMKLWSCNCHIFHM